MICNNARRTAIIQRKASVRFWQWMRRGYVVWLTFFIKLGVAVLAAEMRLRGDALDAEGL